MSISISYKPTHITERKFNLDMPGMGCRLQLPSQYPLAGLDIHHKVHTLVEQTEKVERHCMEQECRMGEMPSLPRV